MTTRRCGPSSSRRPGSSAGEPSRKLPAGTTTISGHAAQSQTRAGSRGAVCQVAKRAARASAVSGAGGAARAAEFSPRSAVSASNKASRGGEERITATASRGGRAGGKVDSTK
jgi:hypothetical protein